MSSAQKVSITVDALVLRDVKQAAARSGRTLSAQITEALARDVRRERLRTLLEEYEAEHGPLGPDDFDAIAEEWRD